MFDLNWRPPWGNKGEDYLAYAEVYKDAIESLLNKIERFGGHSYQPLPLFYLLRHYVEIMLTGLIIYSSTFSFGYKNLEQFLKDKRKSHDLLVLFNKLKECEHCLKFSKDFEYFLKNLDSFDKKSDRFRYPEDSKGKSYFRSNSPNKKFFEVLNYPEQLKKYVKIVIDNLEGLEAFFDIVKEGKEIEAEINNEYKKESYNSI